MAKIQKSNMTLTDAKGKTLREPNKDNASQTSSFRWFVPDLSPVERAQAVAATIRQIQTHQSSRMEQLVVSTRLYGNTSAFSLLGTAFTRSSSVNSNPMSQRISYNLCQSVIDTLISKIAKNKVIPTFLTNGGIWKMQRKAEKLSRFLDGCFYSVDMHMKTVMAFFHAAMWGDGLAHVFDNHGKVGVEPVMPHEIFVDMVESLATDPQQLHRVKFVDKDILIDLFPDSEDEIRQESSASAQDVGGSGTVADLMMVTESWHLPSGPDKNDGLHVICCGDNVLLEEPWEKDYFPFVKLPYAKRPFGYWSQGACERLQNLQGEINRTMILDQRSRWMMGSFKILVENGSKVVSQHLNNEVGSIIHYTGTPPQYVTPPAIQGDTQGYIDGLIAKGYQQEGVSQLASSSMKPEGVESGAALRTFDKIGDDRFLFVGQQVEAFVLEVGRQMIEVAKDIYKRTGTYKVQFPSANFLETIDWKDIKLEADEYVLKAYPTSSLPDDPAGRLATIQEYMQAGLMSPRAGRKLMAMPDVEMSDALANAKEDLLHKIFEDILDNEEFTPPEPFFDMALARSLLLDYYNYGMLHNASPEALGMLQDFGSQLDDLAGIAAPPMGALGMQPQGVPMPSPQSNMIPNVQGGPTQ